MGNDDRTPICPMMSISAQLSKSHSWMRQILSTMMVGPMGMFSSPTHEPTKLFDDFHPCIGSRCALWHTNKMQSNIGRCNLNPEMSQYKDPALIEKEG